MSPWCQAQTNCVEVGRLERTVRLERRFVLQAAYRSRFPLLVAWSRISRMEAHYILAFCSSLVVSGGRGNLESLTNGG